MDNKLKTTKKVWGGRGEESEGDGTNNKAIGEIKQVHREVRVLRVCGIGMGDGG